MENEIIKQRLGVAESMWSTFVEPWFLKRVSAIPTAKPIRPKKMGKGLPVIGDVPLKTGEWKKGWGIHSKKYRLSCVLELIVDQLTDDGYASITVALHGTHLRVHTNDLIDVGFSSAGESGWSLDYYRCKSILDLAMHVTEEGGYRHTQQCIDSRYASRIGVGIDDHLDKEVHRLLREYPVEAFVTGSDQPHDPILNQNYRCIPQSLAYQLLTRLFHTFEQSIESDAFRLD